MAKFDAILFNSGFVAGSTVYEDYYPGDEGQNRIVLNAAPEGQKGADVKMIVDTGAPWCILNPRLLEEWDLISEAPPSPTTKLNVRGEIRRGRYKYPSVIPLIGGVILEDCVRGNFFDSKTDLEF